MRRDGHGADDWARLARAIVNGRLRIGMNQSALGRAANLSGATLCRIESGTRIPRPETIALIEAAIGWPQGTAQEILDGGELPEPEDDHSDAPNGADWGRLGAVLRAERERQGLSRAALADRAEISEKSIQTAEGGAVPKGRRPYTLSALEWALGWASGSVDAVLQGGEPVYGPPIPTSTPRTTRPSRRSLALQQQALADDLYVRALSLRAASDGDLSIREAVELAVIQAGVESRLAEPEPPIAEA